MIDFIEDQNASYPIAVVAGIRRVGKTTVLKQLQGYYPDAVYLNLSDSKGGFDMIAGSSLERDSRGICARYALIMPKLRNGTYVNKIANTE